MIVSCSASIVLLTLFVPSVCIYVVSGGVKNISNQHMSFVPLLFFSFPFPRTVKPESPVMVAVQSAADATISGPFWMLFLATLMLEFREFGLNFTEFHRM